MNVDKTGDWRIYCFGKYYNSDKFIRTRTNGGPLIAMRNRHFKPAHIRTLIALCNGMFEQRITPFKRFAPTLKRLIKDKAMLNFVSNANTTMLRVLPDDVLCEIFRLL